MSDNVISLNRNAKPTDKPLVEEDVLADDFGDVKTLWNSRIWLQSALEGKGAKVFGYGMGDGQVDLDIKLEGQMFNVSIRPILVE